jgi:hypothetical protein
VIGPPKWVGEASSHAELLDVMRKRQLELGLSNELVDHIACLSQGHCDKLLGPGRQRGLSQLSLDALMGALAVRLIIAEDPERAAQMRPRWEGKDASQVRMPARIAKDLIARVRPAVLRDLGRRAGQARWRGIDPKLRSRLMRELARLRWDASKNASEPVAQQETATQ